MYVLEWIYISVVFFKTLLCIRGGCLILLNYLYDLLFVESDKSKKPEEEHKEKGLVGDGFSSDPFLSSNRGNPNLHKPLMPLLPFPLPQRNFPDYQNVPEKEDGIVKFDKKNENLSHDGTESAGRNFDTRFKPIKFLENNQDGNRNEKQINSAEQQKSQLDDQNKASLTNEITDENDIKSNIPGTQVLPPLTLEGNNGRLEHELEGNSGRLEHELEMHEGMHEDNKKMEEVVSFLLL